MIKGIDLRSLKSIWVLTLLIKLLLAALLPLSSDEAYYWVWSQKLQLSYYDHPPFVAWLFKFGHLFQNFGQGVRWPAVLLGHGILLIWLLIWKKVAPNSQEKYKWWLWLALCSPLLGFGSIIVTPDLPVLFFWSLSILFFLKALDEKNLQNYLALGAALGLGFCSKYHIVLFVPITLIYLTLEKKWKSVSWKGVGWTILIGLLFSLPVLIWNYQNDFISFRFQLKHGLSRPEYQPYWTWTYVLAQLIVLFPTVVWSALRSRLQGASRAFLYFGWGPLAFFFLSSFKALVEVNWPIIAYPAFLAMAALGASSNRWLKWANFFWMGIFLLLSLHLFRPWIPNAPEKVSEFSQFEPIHQMRAKYEPLYANTYQMASWVWYRGQKPFYKLLRMSRYDLFDSMPEGQPQQGTFYVAMKNYDELPEWIKTDAQFKVTRVEELENEFVIVRVEK